MLSLVGLCGMQACQYLCVRAEHCQVGQIRRRQLLAGYRDKRRIMTEELKVILRLQAILQPQREFKAVGELRNELNLPWDMPQYEREMLQRISEREVHRELTS